MEFLEHHVRSLYRLLNHGDYYSDLRCIDVNTGTFINRTLVTSEEEVVSWAKLFNGKGNCFIGRNPRNQDGTVSKVTTFSFDIDPEREKGTSSTNEQLKTALQSGRRILQRIKNGYLGCSGNGALVLYRLTKPKSELSGSTSTKLRAIADSVRGLVDSSVKIDNTHDDARMIKLLGTMSTKGEVHRVSKFIDFPLFPFRSSDAFESREEIVVAEVPQTTIESTGTSYSQAERLQLLEKALPLLKQERCEDYDSWIKCGLALKEFGAVGYRLWNQFSKRSSKYSEDACASKWGSFQDNSRISIGSIIHWAREDSGQTIRLESSKPTTDNRCKVVTVFSPNGNLVEHKQRLLSKAASSGPEISSGLPLLDKLTGGLLRGEIYTVAARTGVGKTSFAVGLTKNLLEQNKRVLFFSTEMSAALIVNRLISSYAQISGDSFKTGRFSEADQFKLDKGYHWLETIGERLSICDLSNPSVEIVKDLTAKCKPDVIIFDHVQHIGGGDNVRAAISEFIRGLKDTARDFNCAVFVLSQLRRMFKDQKTGLLPTPQLSDLKESGTIEEESGQVLLLSELSSELGTSFCILMGELAKNRFGECAKVGIEFDRATACFKEIVNSDLIN